MFEKEFQEWFELNKKWLYSMDHVQAAYSAWCAGVKQQQAVEQPLAPDGETHLCGGEYYTDKVLGEVCCRCQAPRR